jgi:hypothetical protein
MGGVMAAEAFLKKIACDCCFSDFDKLYTAG